MVTIKPVKKESRARDRKRKRFVLKIGGRCPYTLHLSRTDVVNLRAQIDLALADNVECRFCGCTNEHACFGKDGMPCSWVSVDRYAGLGVCSRCASKHSGGFIGQGGPRP